MKREPTKRQMKNRITRTGKLLGGYVPAPIADGIQKWINRGTERDISTFLREAAREKLRREGIEFQEREAA
jgi:hypothetical protein